MSDPRASEIVLARITDWSAFASLRAEWNALAAECTRPSVFLTHEWFDAAWQWKGRESSLSILCARRAGQLVGALPLVASRRASRLGMRRVLESLTVPDTQLFDMLVLPDDRERVADGFADFLAKRQGEWDMLELGYLPEPSVIGTALSGALRPRAYKLAVETDGTNPYIDLQGTWEAYYATRTRSLKKANNLAANRINKTGDVRIRWHEPGLVNAARLGEIIDALVSVSSRSWKRETGNSLDNPGPQAFIRRLSELAAGRSWLSVWTLDLDDAPVAMEYQLVFDRGVYALRADFDAAFGEVSPGSHLNRALMERLFGGRFRRYYMGPGENTYKLRWTERSEALQHLIAYARTARGRFAALVDLSLVPLARSARAKLRRRDPAPPDSQ
jgi:CelD/BcsL family acetyltransferase involved in cellulose biosynthesis